MFKNALLQTVFFGDFAHWEYIEMVNKCLQTNLTNFAILKTVRNIEETYKERFSKTVNG